MPLFCKSVKNINFCKLVLAGFHPSINLYSSLQYASLQVDIEIYEE